MFDNLNPVLLLLLIAAAVFVFFILRELSLWFYKINEIVKNQDTTNTLLRLLVNLQITDELGNDILVKNTETKEYSLMERDEWIKLHKESPEQSTYIKV